MDTTGLGRRYLGVIWNWWRQGMMEGAKAHYDGIVAFSQTDFTEDLKKITVPVLVMHGDDDNRAVCRCGTAVGKATEEGTLKTYKASAWHTLDSGRHDQRRLALSKRNYQPTDEGDYFGGC